MIEPFFPFALSCFHKAHNLATCIASLGISKSIIHFVPIFVFDDISLNEKDVLTFMRVFKRNKRNKRNKRKSNVVLPPIMGVLPIPIIKPMAFDTVFEKDLPTRTDGKEVCAYLRSIRNDLAKANNISFESEPCDFEGDCAGTCEKCDQEAAYLRDELSKIPEKKRKYPEHTLEDWIKALCLEK